MLKNTSKTVDQVYGTMRAVYLAWEEHNLPMWAQTFWESMEDVPMTVFGLACMRLQRKVADDKKYGEFFTALWDAKEGRD